MTTNVQAIAINKILTASIGTTRVGGSVRLGVTPAGGLPTGVLEGSFPGGRNDIVNVARNMNGQL